MKRSDLSTDFIQRMIRFVDDCEKGISQINNDYKATQARIRQQANDDLQAAKAWRDNALRNLGTKCAQLSVGVRSLIRELDSLEAVIERTDKFYKRTKARADDARDFPSLHTSDDYVEALQSVVARFRTLSSKYTQNTLPVIINELHYLISRQRREDYAELVALKNYAARLDAEVKDSLAAVKAEETRAIEEEYNGRCASIQDQYASRTASLDADYGNQMDSVAQAMLIRIEEVLPRDEISQLNQFMNLSLARNKAINGQLNAFPAALMPYSYVFPLDEYVSNKAVRSCLADHCSSLLKQDSFIVLPSLFMQNEPMNLMLEDPERDSATVKNVQQIMLTFLSHMPVSKQRFAVIDPEHHGNSISPYFELQRAEPDTLYESIAVSQEEIDRIITSLSDYIDDALRYHLNGEDDNVFNRPENACSILVTVFDFPAQFSDRALQTLRNILRNGYRCGIRIVIMKSKAESGGFQHERESLLKEIDELCTVITCDHGIMMTSGLECLFPLLPEPKELSGYLNRYLLTCTSLKNEGFVFNRTIRDLIVADNEQEVGCAIDTLNSLAETATAEWCSNTENAQAFPEQIMLGGAYYPFSVFTGRPAEDVLRRYYRITSGQGAGVSQEYVFLPYSFDTVDGYNLYIEYCEKESGSLISAVHHIMWRMLSSFPVSKLHFSVISCENSLNSIIPFGQLIRELPDMFEGGICSNTDQVADRLQQISQSIEDTLQNKLGSQFRNMIEYNIATPNRAEPLTLLVIFDYPKGFDARRNEILSSILRNGRKCGVFTIICHNTDIPYSRYDTLDEFLASVKKNAVQMLCKAGKVYLQPYGIEMSITDLPDDALITGYTGRYVSAYAQLQRKGLGFREIVDASLFSRSSAKVLTIPIGLGDGDSVINVQFGTGSSHHALIAGATGSGKSTLLHTIIMSSMLHYSPSELHLYLLDFKSGTEFKTYERVKLPHMKLLALDAMQEFGESILEDLVNEMTARSEAFKSAGCQKVEEYVRETGKPMPRILVIMDEFQILYNDSTNRKVAYHCAELTKRLVTEGRAYGIHLIMATQSTKVITNLALETGTIEQMRIRIGMKCGESDARYLFGDRNEQKALQMMKGPIGTAVLNQEYTEEDNIGLRVAYCDSDTMKAYQDQIADAFRNEPYTLQIFEGSRTTDLLDYLVSENKIPYESDHTEINLGIMVKVAPPFTLAVDRRRRHNMVICGANDEMTSNLVTLYQLSVLRNRHARIIDINGEWLVSDEYESSLQAAISNRCSRFTACTQRPEILRAVKDLHTDYTSRKNGTASSPVFVFIRNLQYLDIIQQMFRGDRIEDQEETPAPSAGGMFDFGQNTGTGSSITDRLQAVINDGYSYGIFFIVTSTEYQVIRETMHYGTGILPKFPERIIFSLGDNDADNLISEVKVSTIPGNTVYFTDGVKRPFQFKPFIAPKKEEAVRHLTENNLLEG